jgi:hypothetical protein
MRFHGTVGYAASEESAPGVWKDVITERTYYGDVIRNSRTLQPPSLVPPEVNDTLSLENSFSIMADAEAYANYMNFRYVEWEGNRWTITNAEIRRPRIILTIGGLWNGSAA